MLLEFNYHSSLLLFGFAQAFIYSAFLLLRARREERTMDYLAAAILITGALYVAQWMLGFGGWYDSHDWRTTLMFYMQWNNLLLLGPLVWLYFRALTNVEFRWKRQHWLHFLPWAILFLKPLIIFGYDMIYFHLMLGRPLEFFYGTRGPLSEWDHNTYLLIFDILFVAVRIHLISYLVLTLLDFRAYKKYLQQEFSNTAQLSFGGLRVALYLGLFGIVLVTLLNVLGYIFSFDYAQAWNSFFVMSVFIYFGAIQFFHLSPSLTRRLRFDPAQALDSEVEHNEANAIPDQAVPASLNVLNEELSELLPLARKLLKHIQQSEVYLQPELSLSELAKQLKTNTSQMSRVINSVYRQNFNDFVNAFRCQAFVKGLQRGEHHQHTLLGMALESGFNSKATFNRAFKKQYGISPGQAAKSIDKGEELNPEFTLNDWLEIGFATA